MESMRSRHREAMRYAERAKIADLDGKDVEARRLARLAFELEREAAQTLLQRLRMEPARSVLFRSAATLALECGEMDEARLLAFQGLAGFPPKEIAAELREILEEEESRRRRSMASVEFRPDGSRMSVVEPAIPRDVVTIVEGSLAVYCVDVGSIKKGNFGWAMASAYPDFRKCRGKDICELVEQVAGTLRAGAKVALGFECPLWVPIDLDPEKLTSGRDGEGSHPFSAAAGAASLVTGLTETTWILERIRQAVDDTEVFLDWRTFDGARRGVFIWEAFVTNKARSGSGGMEADPHELDAKMAVDAFIRALPDPTSRDALKPTPRTRSLIGAALLETGWSNDIDLLRTPCMVIKP